MPFIDHCRFPHGPPLMAEAGNAGLMTAGLCQTLCDHAMGNYRVLTQMAAELLAAATQCQLDQLDEKLFLELYGPPQQPARRKTAR